MANSAKKIIIIGLILACIICIFFWKAVFLGETTIGAVSLYFWYPWRHYVSLEPALINPETTTVFYPLRFYAREMIRTGQIPLWDPYLFCGTPFLANTESAVFSPFSLIFYLFPLVKAFSYASIIQIFLAGLFMFLFMRAINAGAFGSFAASLVFMFNGFFMVWLEDQNPVFTALWLPLMLLFLEKMIRGGPRRYFFAIISAVVIGFQFFNHTQTALYGLLAAVIYSVIRIFQSYYDSDRKEILRCFSFLGAAILLGFALAAIQLIPFYELVVHSQRTGDLYKYRFQLIDPAILLHLITFVAANIYGSLADHNYWGAGDYAEQCAYLGILPLVLAIFAIFRRKDKLILPFLIIAAFSLLVYLDTPVSALLYLVPGYNRTLGIPRIIFLYLFSGSVLSGLGADYLRKEADLKIEVRKLNKLIIRCLFIAIFLFLAGNFTLQMGKDYIVSRGEGIANILVGVEPNFDILTKKFFKSLSISYINYLKYYHLLSPVIYFPFFLAAASIWLFTLYLKKGASLFFQGMLYLIILADLFFFGWKELAMAKPQMIYPEVEAVRFLKNDSGLWRASCLNDGTAFPPNTLAPYKIHSSNGEGSLFSQRYAEYMYLIDKDISLDSNSAHLIRLADYNSILMDLLNIKYVLTKKELKENKFRLIYNKDVRIYENTKVFPRAFVVPHAVVIKEKREILRYLSSDNFKPSKYVILEEEPMIKDTALSLELFKDSKVMITEYSAHAVSIEADLPDNGFLVLSDTYFPGWKVYVDGKKEKIFCANYIMRAVYLPKGNHKVKFIYDPASFKAGKYVSFAGFILVVLSLAALLSELKKHNGN